MSIVVGLHLQSDRVHATICRDHPNTSSAPRVEPFRTFPAALRWRSQASPALADHRVDGVYRHFVDRLGDPRAMSGPGGPDRLADQLTAALLTEIVRTIERSLGQHVDRVLIAHPAYWTVPQVHLMHYSLVDTGIDRHRALLLVPDTDAALEWIDHTAGLADAHGVTICNLREDSAVIGYARRPHSGHLTTTTAHRFPGLGLHHFDDLLQHRVLAKAQRAGHPVPHHPALLAQVRAHCAEVRTTLRGTATRMIVDTPSAGGLEHHGIVLTLDDLYALARPQAAETVRAMARHADPDHVVLIGAAPTFPLLPDTVAARFGCPVVMPDDPELVCARGAALIAAMSLRSGVLSQ